MHSSLHPVTARPHTGSRRNEAAEQAILRAAAELLAAEESALITVDAIAVQAGVGKQTIYRWWPSKSAVLLDAMIQRADEVAPAPDSGDLQSDLRRFLRSTFAAAPSSVLVGRLLDNPATRYVARISFGIYVWHYPVLELIRVYWDPQINHGAAVDPVRFAMTSAIVTGITVVIAHISYTMLEAPVIRWARSRERRPDAQRPDLSPAVS